MDNSRIVVPARRDADDAAANRSRHIIPTPRSNGVFPGWGVRF